MPKHPALKRSTENRVEFWNKVSPAKNFRPLADKSAISGYV
jgi:hypothetical protein